jgi:ABC-type oligopeptide transport system substrate-binding subunit
VSIYGLYSQFTSTWFNFCTNVTDAAGNLREFQPFTDWRFRKAVVHAVNLTDININVNNRIWLQADNLIPPGTAPPGAYDPNAAPRYELNLTLTEQLLLEAMNDPMTQFTHYNGTPISAGVIDNSFGDANPRLIELYVPSGAETNQKVLTVLIQNLNQISIDNDMGLTWAIVTVPGGQQYTLAAQHRVHMYWGGWHADYNHIMNWLWPMLHSQGSYFSWNLINDTILDSLLAEVEAADKAGDAATVLAKSLEMVQRANEQVYYLMLWYRMSFFVRSSFLKNYYFNAALGSDVYTSMYYETN